MSDWSWQPDETGMTDEEWPYEDDERDPDDYDAELRCFCGDGPCGNSCGRCGAALCHKHNELGAGSCPTFVHRRLEGLEDVEP